MAKILSQTEFDSLPIEDIKSILKSIHKINIQKNASELMIRDLARNKLHGTHFIFSNEEVIDDKIHKKPIILNKNFEKCPNCLQKTLILQPFAKSSGLQGSKYCTGCGYLEKPSSKKAKTNSSKPKRSKSD